MSCGVSIHSFLFSAAMQAQKEEAFSSKKFSGACMPKAERFFFLSEEIQCSLLSLK